MRRPWSPSDQVCNLGDGSGPVFEAVSISESQCRLPAAGVPPLDPAEGMVIPSDSPCSAYSDQPSAISHAPLRTVRFCLGIQALVSFRCLRSLQLKIPAFSGSPARNGAGRAGRRRPASRPPPLSRPSGLGRA